MRGNENNYFEMNKKYNCLPLAINCFVRYDWLFHYCRHLFLSQTIYNDRLWLNNQIELQIMLQNILVHESQTPIYDSYMYSNDSTILAIIDSFMIIMIINMFFSK